MSSFVKQVLAVFLGVSLFFCAGCGMFLLALGYSQHKQQAAEEKQKKEYYEALKNGDLPGLSHE